jgi:nucleoside-diphosphate-sugar epimerase
MKVLVAGATGALGRELVPQLVAAGHEVTGMTRSPRAIDGLRALGAGAVVADALDAAAVREAVAKAQPEVVVHQLTALKGDIDPKKFDQSFAMTNRLRTEGTDNLLAAAKTAGVRRMVAQSFAGWNLARTGGPVKTEDDPLDPEPATSQVETMKAIRYVESVVTGDAEIEGLALRYAGFYGPGSAIGSGGSIAARIKARKVPIVGDGGGVWSFIHFADAASATVRAVEHGDPGIYQVADDEPAPVSVWLPELARILGAKPPRRVPAWLGRLVAGEAAVRMFTEARGADNSKAKRELGWTLRYPSWRQGFREGL